VSSSSGLARLRPGLATREVAFLLILAAGAWAATVALARGMAGMAGHDGAGPGRVRAGLDADDGRHDAPVGVARGLAVRQDHPRQTGDKDRRGLVVGYLAVWSAAGVPAYGLAWLAGWLTGKHSSAAHVMAVAVFAVCGIYQLSPLKDRCLAHCRSPLGLLLRYGSYRGRPRDLRVGAHHGGYCWGLMVILIAVGVMNVAAMVGVATLVLIEKAWRWGPAAGRLAGVVALALAVATIWLPWLAPGLHAAPQMMMN
jgi:predicted metal-binding membrane protein